MLQPIFHTISSIDTKPPSGKEIIAEIANSQLIGISDTVIILCIGGAYYETV